MSGHYDPEHPVLFGREGVAEGRRLRDRSLRLVDTATMFDGRSHPITDDDLTSIPRAGLKRTLAERFWDRVGRVGGSACWLWRGSLDSHGYGQIEIRRDGHRRNLRAHRVSYTLLIGPVPFGMELDHLCRNRACVNPGHLEPVTQAENIKRGNGASATNRRKTHCSKGHPYDDANTIRLSSGVRLCRTCNRENCRAAYWRRKAAQ